MATFKKSFPFWSFAALLALATFSGCDPLAGCGDAAPETNMLEGKITGYDVRDCACCGGYYLEAGDVIFNFDELPAGSTILLEEDKFPIKVKFDFNEVPNACNDKGVKITLTTIELQ